MKSECCLFFYSQPVDFHASLALHTRARPWGGEATWTNSSSGSRFLFAFNVIFQFSVHNDIFWMLRFLWSIYSYLYLLWLCILNFLRSLIFSVCISSVFITYTCHSICAYISNYISFFTFIRYAIRKLVVTYLNIYIYLHQSRHKLNILLNFDPSIYLSVS